MRQFNFTAAVFSVLSLLPMAIVSGGDPLQIGDQVMPRHGAKLQLGVKTVPLQSVPQPLTVHKIQAPWVWVGTAWAKRDDLVPLKDAASYYTELMRRNPSSAAAYNSRGIVWDVKGELANAEKDFTEAIRLQPDHFAAYNNRGNVRDRVGNVDGALRDFTEAIRLKPDNPMALNNRALIWRAKGEWANAEKDFAEAIRLDSKFSAALINRASLRQQRGDLAGAMNDLNSAVRVDGHSHAALNARAWLLATTENEAIHDGKLAVADALRACNLTAWQKAGYLDTLAAAYAATGDFGRAILWQTKAIELASADEVDDCRERLDLYTAGKRYIK